MEIVNCHAVIIVEGQPHDGVKGAQEFADAIQFYKTFM